MRIHPAASRVEKLARRARRRSSSSSTCWSTRRGGARRPAARRTARDARGVRGALPPPQSTLSVSRRSRRTCEVARRWLRALGAGTRRRDRQASRPAATGRASAPECRKSSACARRTASSAGSASDGEASVVGSLLLGLYDDAACSHHVGFTSSIKAAESAGADHEAEAAHRAAGVHRASARADPAAGAPSAAANGSRSRPSSWPRSSTITSPEAASATGRDSCAGARTRPRQCTMDQVAQESASTLALLATAVRLERSSARAVGARPRPVAV